MPSCTRSSQYHDVSTTHSIYFVIAGFVIPIAFDDARRTIYFCSAHAQTLTLFPATVTDSTANTILTDRCAQYQHFIHTVQTAVFHIPSTVDGQMFLVDDERIVLFQYCLVSHTEQRFSLENASFCSASRCWEYADKCGIQRMRCFHFQSMRQWRRCW